MPFGTLVDVETLEPVIPKPSQPLTNQGDFSNDMSEEVLAEFFGPSTCFTGTLPEHAQQNYGLFCKKLIPVPIAEPLQFPSSKGLKVLSAVKPGS